MPPALNIEPKLLERVNGAIADIRAGKMVILVDDEDRENEGDLTIAAQFVTPDAVNFMAMHGRGLICLCLTPERCDELGLRQMTDQNEAQFGTAFTVTIEARDGVSLTVAELLEDAFAVALVPHTLEATTLRDLAPGQPVNLEADVLAKYVERLVAPGLR